MQCTRAVICAAILSVSAGCGDSQKSPPSVQLASTPPAAPPKSATTPDPNLTVFQSLMNDGRFWDARNFALLNLAADPAIKSHVSDAEIKAYLQTIKDPKAPKDKKQKALIALARDYPEQAQPYAEAVTRAQSEADKASGAKAAAMERKIAAEARKQGVRIGMVQEEVIMSSWGRPRHVNRTVTAGSVREQWVYGGGYLYFEDGRLTAIQN